MNSTLKPKIKYYCQFLIQYGINESKNLLVFILLFLKSLLLLSFAVIVLLAASSKDRMYCSAHTTVNNISESALVV